MASEFVRWICADAEGKTHEATPTDYPSRPLFGTRGGSTSLLRQFLDNELGLSPEGECEPQPHMPAHIRLMRRHELVDTCDASERGHLKWYPKGLLIYQLLTDRAREFALD